MLNDRLNTAGAGGLLEIHMRACYEYKVWPRYLLYCLLDDSMILLHGHVMLALQGC